MTRAIIDYLEGASLLYGCVWEDDALLCEGLAIEPDDDVLSICSAGDNVLALALAGAKSVTAVDLNTAQLAMLELKLAAVEQLSYDDFLSLIGERPGPDARELLLQILPALSPGARRHWQQQAAAVETGLWASGRLERYVAAFAHDHLPSLVSKAEIDALLRGDDPSPAWLENPTRASALRQLFSWYFGRSHMAENGRSSEQLAHVTEHNQGELFFARLQSLVRRGLAQNNPYLERFLTGRVRTFEHGPRYLVPSEYERLKSLTARITLEHAEIGIALERHPAGAFSKANLSDLFEYLDEDTTASLFAQLASRLRPRGRIAYWNLLVERSPRGALTGRLTPALSSASLHARDRVFFYRAFRVDEAREQA